MGTEVFGVQVIHQILMGTEDIWSTGKVGKGQKVCLSQTQKN